MVSSKNNRKRAIHILCTHETYIYFCKLLLAVGIALLLGDPVSSQKLWHRFLCVSAKRLDATLRFPFGQVDFASIRAETRSILGHDSVFLTLSIKEGLSCVAKVMLSS